MSRLGGVNNTGCGIRVDFRSARAVVVKAREMVDDLGDAGRQATPSEALLS